MNRDKSKPKVIVICGPTGSGKTAAAIELAVRFNGQIISADSMQIYRFMDIGTAKPTLLEQQQVQHHLIDVVTPDEPFNAARFADMAQSLISGLQGKGFVPFVVGGTGLYIKALLKGLFPAEPVDPALRSRLKKEAAAHGAAFLHRRLGECDPEAAGRIHPNDTYRILRALEIYESTGQSISQFQSDHGFSEKPFSVLKIGLDTDRIELYERINGRVDRMIAAGLLPEVKNLLDRGYAPTLKSMQSIGYRHLVDFLEGRLSWPEALRTFKRDTRRYAKRQLTWFKSDGEINWVAAEDTTRMMDLANNFLTDAC
ncbi:MAG: tRNA (adenosine(37)-N6)-dimethylallyltransferase MiaA [Desulfobacterales bacterium]|nr:tRNA (adenosine(37)-N6)-dimethylallyltransferase MiaA [Desulfobacterales bacterium]